MYANLLSSFSVKKKEKKAIQLRSKREEKSRKKCCGLCCRAAYVIKNFFKAQNPLLINKSGFKLRAAYDGVRTVLSLKIIETTDT